MTIFFTATSGNVTLQNYLTEVQRLLHDSLNTYWSQPELIDYINDGRKRLVSDTGCLRSLQSLTLTQGQETYPLSGLPSGTTTIDILNLTVIWGSSRIPLQYMPFTELNARLRTWTSMQSRPIAFSIYGQNTIYVGPIPDQTYAAEVDTVVMPPTLVNLTDVETINYPFTPPVAFYAAYKAKLKEQSYKESEVFLQMYQSKVQESLRAQTMRRIPNVYSS